MIRDSPVPTWMPLITGIGIRSVNQFISPVMLRKPMPAATKMPALAISALLKFCARATAAMAFMGCTGRGMPKARPVSMLARPLKTSVLEREMARVWVSAMRMGRSVPMSPKEPEISVKGWREKVSMLYRWIRRKSVFAFLEDSFMEDR